MKYELAKELKDAGYEMDYNLDGFSDFDKRTADIDLDLSELIEACGNRFISLERDHIDPTEEASFIATGKFSDYIEMHGYTDDPTSAVARLWLALNKK